MKQAPGLGGRSSKIQLIATISLQGGEKQNLIEQYFETVIFKIIHHPV